MFPIACVWISRYTPVIISIAWSTLVLWLGVNQCKISWKLRLNISNKNLQTMMENIDKFAARQTRPILTNTRSSRLHVLYKIGVLKNLAKIHGQTPVLEFLFNKGAALRPSTLLKRHSSAGFFLWILRNFENIFFTEHLRTTASVIPYKYRRINKYMPRLVSTDLVYCVFCSYCKLSIL